ncbi:Beta-adaptin-like protein C [Durusdinium trenchii]|uniref:Beta-adaptin-like protein C n=1 Tax=Durusdinium trenchii TaxID=1381693 RepID=A0ABP0RJ27_9DINO
MMAEEEGGRLDDENRQLLRAEALHQPQRSGLARLLKCSLVGVALGALCLLIGAAAAPCTFQVALERLALRRTSQLYEKSRSKVVAGEQARATLDQISSEEEAARVANRTLEEAGRRALESFEKRMRQRKQRVLMEEAAKLKSKVSATLPPDPVTRDLGYISKKLQLEKNKLDDNLGITLKKNRQNVLVRCLLDVLASVQNVAVLGITIKGEIDTCKATGSSPMMTRLDMLEPGGQAIDGWEETDKAKLACFLNSNGLVFVMSNLATALSFAAGDCAFTIDLPDAALEKIYTNNNSAYFDRLCAANIASTINVISQFASAGAMVGTSCPNANSPVSAPASTFGTGEDDTFQDSNAAFDDVAYDAGSPRRLQGAAGGGQPTLGTGSSGNDLACLLDAQGVMFSIMQIGVEWDYAQRLNCETGDYANGPTTETQVIAEKKTRVSSALCSANVGGVIQGFVNIITVGQIMVMHCDNIMTASRMCGQGIAMFFSAAANLVRGTGQLYDFCQLRSFNADQVVQHWDLKKEMYTRRLQQEERFRNVDPEEFFLGLYKNASGHALDIKNTLRGEKEWRKLLQLADPAIKEAERLKGKKEPTKENQCS